MVFKKTARVAMKEKWMALLLFLGVFGFYVHGASPTVTTGDSGEFMTAAATLSIPHAPSYPLYSVLGKAFINLIPWAGIPYRLNVFSAFLSSLTLTLLFTVCLRLSGDPIKSLFVSL